MMENQDNQAAGTQRSNGKRVNLGLTSSEALAILIKEINSTVKEHYDTYKKKRKYKKYVKDALYHRSKYTTFCWTSAVSLIIMANVLILLSFLTCREELSSLKFQGLTIILLVILNLVLVVSDNKLRHHEIAYRVKILSKMLEDAAKFCHWEMDNFPHLCTPLSPCITLQWTYRDGHLVNLPWALLVMGDIIVLKPGQQAPGYCTPCDDSEGPVLHAKDIYVPHLPAGGFYTMPQARLPLKNRVYKLQETPYLENLRLALEQSLNRPVTYHNRMRHLLMIFCIEQLIFPILLAITVFINFIRYFYLPHINGSGNLIDLFILQPISVTIPLLPVTFPIWWIFLNCFGMARFKALFELYQSANKTQFFDPFEDITDPNHPEVVYNWNELSIYFWNILTGKEQMMSRSANIVHVLGSVTALCCVDKKGILSWPNPTAEKVFFLRNPNTQNNANTNSVSQASSNISLHKAEDSLPTSETKPNSNRNSYIHREPSGAFTEVLDLTHDRNLPFRLQFDDQSWSQHINSLKPLGLAILLNTCNMETQEHYTQFCNYITCEAFQNENLVPVTNRRYQVNKEGKSTLTLQNSKQMYLVDESGCLGQMWCLCELAKQIGFKEQSTEIFHLEHQLSTFKHVPDTAKRDIKFAKSLSLATKLKFPFPHMVGVVVKEKYGGGSQLFTQGTADIILDSCIEFWDGHDIFPLSEIDKKNIQDFYNRMSLTSYCSAFAYRPLHKSISNNISNIYLELPCESRHLYTQQRSPTPLSWDVLDSRHKGCLGQSHSTDSLLCNESKDEEINTIDGCFELQCNQIFIGMVTMQYQAQTDMVQLIEQLDRACIRFVHFSKENELRSRVFSEKMGLESGWNCHISLLSEKARSESPVGWWVSQAAAISSPTPSARSHRLNNSCMDEASQLLNRVTPRANLDNTRAMSMSAPSVINIGPPLLKFDNENADWNKSGIKSQAKSTLSQREQNTERSDDSVLVQSVDLGSGHEAWRSLSCLTDSTEQSAPINFDLSNRAKLPKGIENIRSHIENIDNVPLLIPLFTDCNTTVTREMLHIMQDYGEVVCVLGSSANAENMPIFMQADAAIGIEPLYPQVCQRVPVLIPTKEEQGTSPIDLSRKLNCISCSLSIKREDPITIYHLIMEARQYMKCLWNCVQFWLCCTVTLSFAQILAIILLLPPLFSVGQVLWLICFIIPLLSVTMVGTQTDPTIMQRATGKNQCAVNNQIAIFVLWCYGLKFLPSAVIVVLWEWMSLFLLCPQYRNPDRTNPESECFYVYPNVTKENLWGGWGDSHHKLYILTTVQYFALTLLVLHFVTISVSFVHREYSIWIKQPFNNWAWFISVIIVLIAQISVSGSILYDFWKNENQRLESFLKELAVYFIVSTPVIFLLNELVKWQEIKLNVRYQKRAHLEFGTKLGMNSPF